MHLTGWGCPPHPNGNVQPADVPIFSWPLLGHGDSEWQLRRALALGPQDAAVMISYSGLAPGIDDRLEVLSARHVPTVYIGTPDARRRHPGLDAYPLVADHEHLQNRITQFASHIAV